ncbi:MAG TPA: SulP family inorganic anion transporter [Anaerolineales bacterium]|nr:SulP family inorganic anion transporter [Anaerolineales bacterium]
MEAIQPEKKTLSSDLTAGLTFALVNIPQSMAHALLASVNPVLGLYTLMVATPVGALFTSATFMNVSTSSALAVAAGDTMITFPSGDRVTALATLVFLIGIFQVLMGVLRLGWVTRFIPYSVMTGFMTGVAVLIIIGQLGDLTGYYSSYSGKLQQLADLLLNRRSILWASLAIGLLTILLVYVLGSTRLTRFSLVLALLIASAAAILLNRFLTADVKQVGDIADVTRSLPSLVIPDRQLILQLIFPAIAIGIIGLVQGAGISQTYPNPDGKFSDVSRDFFGQGAANLAGGLFGGLPAGGSSSGSALIVNAGAQSRWANIFAGLAVTAGVLLFANLVELVAMPALAGLVIVAGIQMVNVNAIQTVWQTNKVSRTIMVTTLVSTLIMPLQYAVLLGVVISIVLFVFQQSNTLRVVEWVAQDVGWPIEQPAPAQLESGRTTVLYIYGNLFYAAADTFEKGLPTAEGTRRAVVILLLRGYDDIGATVITALRRYTTSLQANGGKLILAGVSSTLQYQLERTGTLHLIGEENIFPATQTIGEAGNAALRAASNWLAMSNPEHNDD